ncbi:MAG: hypothetical protein IJ794_12855 [Lachnospiraceae bacterium]|nr:hypothetical protein [Lachnospiraceae bacterium]MBQ8118909.1 hypothetical protein [Lachnospiraceae bacterium]MBR1854010.1 hypothetical protein [Lachnospiraceae bacterium]
MDRDYRDRLYLELVEKIVEMGYPKSFGEQIGKALGSEKALMRMIGYLYSVRPKTAEEIADEMLAIVSDRDRWVQKKQAEYYNSKYNELLRDGLE